MALFILQPGLQPLGQFDFDDTDLPNVLGGDLGTFDEAARANSTTVKAAADVLDGYIADLVDVGTPTASRPVVRLADSSTETNNMLYLLDDGAAPHYGTLFGSLIGAPVGLATSVQGSTALGPHSAYGSGKVTLWGQPGLYGVSLDALHASVVPTASGNLYDTPLPGEKLYRAASTAKLGRTQVGSEKFVAAFIELSGSRSLVTTPAKLVGASETFDRIVIQYVGVGATF